MFHDCYKNDVHFLIINNIIDQKGTRLVSSWQWHYFSRHFFSIKIRWSSISPFRIHKFYNLKWESTTFSSFYSLFLPLWSSLPSLSLKLSLSSLILEADKPWLSLTEILKKIILMILVIQLHHQHNLNSHRLKTTLQQKLKESLPDQQPEYRKLRLLLDHKLNGLMQVS